MTALEKYRDLERKLKEVRERTGDLDCSEEDEILDAMDPVWLSMTDEERLMVDPSWGGHSER